MSIKFEPDKMLKKIAPAAKIRRMITKGLSLKRAALSFIDAIDFIDRDKVTETALNTIAGYQDRVAKEALESGREAGRDEKREILDDPKQLIQRVQNQIVFQIHEGIKDKYAGERARWLPSSANEPRPEHQLNYGKEYVIGEGIGGVEPGDEWGCQCGVEILVNETKLNL